MRGRISFYTIVIAGLVAAASAGPDEASLKVKVRQFEESMRNVPRQEQAERRAELADQLLDKADFSSYSPAQLALIVPLIQSSPELVKPALERLQQMNDDSSIEGVHAKIIAAVLERGSPSAAPSAEKLAAILSDPNLPALTQAGYGLEVFSLIAGSKPAAYVDYLPTLLNLVDALPNSIDSNRIDDVSAFYRSLAYICPNPSEQLEPLRTRLLGYIDPEIAKLRAAEDATLARRIDVLENARTQLAIINSTTPELMFVWNSNPEFSRLSQLRGKVVVIDFWATWCGPCVASFPRIRHLEEHYAGYPVEVLGVTSVQGSHTRINPQTNERERIDTGADPTREFQLMPEFMQAMNMTWDVAFSDEPVQDDRFGVYGIPHLVIIDPDGKVRVNGLNPLRLSEQQEYTLVDSILREFNLPTPDTKVAD